MAEKGSEKKFLALLVVLVVLSLGVNLLSLNVLYTLGRTSNLGGELLDTRWESSSSESGCSVITTSDDIEGGSCEDNCVGNWNRCEFNACETRYSCIKDCEDGCYGGASLCELEYESNINSCSDEMSDCIYGC